MTEFVHMHHPEVDACAEAPREAFDQVWSENGWTEEEPHDDQTNLEFAEVKPDAPVDDYVAPEEEK